MVQHEVIVVDVTVCAIVSWLAAGTTGRSPVGTKLRNENIVFAAVA